MNYVCSYELNLGGGGGRLAFAVEMGMSLRVVRVGDLGDVMKSSLLRYLRVYLRLIPDPYR